MRKTRQRDEQQRVPKPNEVEDFCGGIIEDVKRRSLVYVSDWTDGLETVKTVTATLCILHFVA